jgi:dihydropteroate synthase
MEFYKISSNDFEKKFLELNCDKSGAKIMAKKSKLHHLYIKDMHVGAANILKQDALSIGADLAVPTGVITAKEKYVDGILLGTTKHFEILAKKELAQPFGLKTLAKELKSFTKSLDKKIQIMGVVNANDDSFFSGSRLKGEEAIKKMIQMKEDGADIIDLGGVSSRPGADKVDPKDELARVKPIIDLIHKEKLYNELEFSIDSYEPLVVDYALSHGFNITNDITGLADKEVAKITAKYDAKVVIMHMQGSPQDMQDNPKYDNLMLEVDQFFKERIAIAKDADIKDENIILDVGIGFGKTLDHNLMLLNNMDSFLHLGYEILLGASRKSMIDKIIPTPVKQRLPGTLAIHLEGINKGASIIRCHDVKEHYQAIQVQQAIKGI